MEKLKAVIETICDNEERNNTVSFYVRVISCINECLNLVDLSQISSSEKEILARGREIWNLNLYNSNELYELYCAISQKCNSIDSATKEYYVLQAVSYLLMPYNKWPDDERANALEYFAGDAIRSGVSSEEIYSIVTKHFGDMNYLNYALEKQKSNPGIEIYGGVSLDLIKSAEQQLDVVFPKEYRAFLLECGSCSIYDTYISGLFKDWDNSTSTGSTLHDTLEARIMHKLPLNYIVLEYSEGENYYVLSIPQNSSEDSKVYSVDIGKENKISIFNEIFSSFEEYFKFTLN